ncbi:MAG: hypothetical protein IRY97_01905 [Thermomicrobiaceae bacterium]|nr:hypothetical protein [Thermomicrobiaceae bacterium]
MAVDDLLRLEAGGGERGITLGDLALSPDGSHLAYRLRHFTRLDVSRGRFDTLEVAPAGDLTRRLEIARGDPGDGLGWGPDGRWLAAGLRGQVVLLSADGRRLIEISPPGKTAAFPIWVRRDDAWEVWFSLDDGQGSRLMSARVW